MAGHPQDVFDPRRKFKFRQAFVKPRRDIEEHRIELFGRATDALDLIGRLDCAGIPQCRRAIDNSPYSGEGKRFKSATAPQL